jgi:hypothetical protein
MNATKTPKTPTIAPIAPTLSPLHETRQLLIMAWHEITRLFRLAVIVFIVTLSAIGAFKIGALSLAAVIVPCGQYTLDSNHSYVEITSHGTRIATITLECTALGLK